MSMDGDKKSVDELANTNKELATELNSDLTNFDKNYFLVASGILTFSVAFLKDIVDIKNSAPLILLYAGWILTAVAIGFILASFLVLSIINGELITAVKKYLLVRNTELDKEAADILITAGDSNLKTRLLFRTISMACFSAGLIFLTVFIVRSLHKEKNPVEKTAGVSVQVNKDTLTVSVKPDTLFLKIIQLPEPPGTDKPREPIVIIINEPPPDAGKPKDPKDPIQTGIVDPPPPDDPIGIANSCPPYPLQNVYFDFNKASLRPESYRELDSLANILRADPAKRVEIRAHTDNRGSDRYNKILSQQRAEAVARYLEDKRILAGRVTSKGFGEDMPIGSNDTEFGRQSNRRVEFKY